MPKGVQSRISPHCRLVASNALASASTACIQGQVATSPLMGILKTVLDSWSSVG